MSVRRSQVSEAEIVALREQYGLDQPMYIQYVKWVGMMLQGNFGMAMEWNRPVKDVIGDRLMLTMVVSLAAIIFTWVLASADRHLLCGPPVLHRSTISSPSSASSGWPSRTSCWP